MVRVIDGSLTKGQKVSSMFSANEGLVKQYEVADVGILNPEMAECTSLHSGDFPIPLLFIIGSFYAYVQIVNHIDEKN